MTARIRVFQEPWANNFFALVDFYTRSIMQRKVATNPHPPPLCGHCQQPAQPGKRLLVCSSCHEACYCSTEHQVADWTFHKVQCKQRKKELKKEKERKESDAAINYLLLNPPIAARPTAAELFESLCIACSKGEVGRARQILLSGVDVNCQSHGFTRQLLHARRATQSAYLCSSTTAPSWTRPIMKELPQH